MTIRCRRWIAASLALLGTTIGAGIFGVPAMIGRVGMMPAAVIFLFLTVVVLLTQQLYLEVVAIEPSRSRLPGYARRIFGPTVGFIATLTHSFQILGASFAYILLGGEFLMLLITWMGFPVSLSVMQPVFWLICVFLACLRMRFLSRIESILTWALIVALIAMTVASGVHADGNLFIVQRWGSAFATIGVFLFALFGFTVVPEVYEIAGRDRRLASRSVALGTIATAILTWLFGAMVFAALGPISSADPVNLASVLPIWLWWLVPILGLLAITTSYITQAYDLIATFEYDVHFSPRIARMFALGIPFVMYLLLRTDFLETIGVVGALFTAGNALLIVLLAHRVLRQPTRRASRLWRETIPMVLSGVFIFVIAQRVFSIFFR